MPTTDKSEGGDQNRQSHEWWQRGERKMAKAEMTNERWAKVALAVAHLNWEACDMAEHDRWVAIAERCYDGTQTDEDRAELEEWHADMSEHYEDDEWYED